MCIINFLIRLTLSCIKWIKNGQILIFNPKFKAQILTGSIWKWFSILNIGLVEYFLLMPWFNSSTFKKLYFLKMGLIFASSYATQNKPIKKTIYWHQLFRQKWAFSRLSSSMLHRCGHTKQEKQQETISKRACHFVSFEVRTDFALLIYFCEHLNLILWIGQLICQCLNPLLPPFSNKMPINLFLNWKEVLV